VKYILISCIKLVFLLNNLYSLLAHVLAQLVEALRYNPEGRGMDCRWYLWNFSLT